MSGFNLVLIFAAVFLSTLIIIVASVIALYLFEWLEEELPYESRNFPKGH